MSLTPSQVRWLSLIQGGIQELEADSKNQEKKNAILTDVLAKLDADKKDIQQAQDFQIEVARHPKLFKLPYRQDKMPWMTGDIQTEADSYADIKPDTPPIPADKVVALNATFGKILERQIEMATATEEDGKTRLFSDEDITRELWTPLVREGVIPSNIVPDKYSQFAQMFKGASQIYEDKLEEHSKTASKYETAFEAIGFTRDVVSLAGNLAGNAITSANFTEASHSRADVRELITKHIAFSGKRNEITSNLAERLNIDPTASDSAILDKAAATGGYESELRNYLNIETLQTELARRFEGQTKLFLEEKALLTLTSSLLDGSLTTAEKGLQFSEKEKTAKNTFVFAQDVADTVAGQIKNVFAATGKIYNKEESQTTNLTGYDAIGDKETLQGLSYASGVISVAMEANQIARKVVMATQAKTNHEKETAVLQIVGSLADTIAETFLATQDVQGRIETGEKDSPNTLVDESQTYAYKTDIGPGPRNQDDPNALIAASIRAFFIASVNTGTAVKALNERDYKKFSESLVLGLMQAAASSTTGPLAAMVKPEIPYTTDEQKAEIDKLSPREILEAKIEHSGSHFARNRAEIFSDRFGEPDYLQTITSNIHLMQEAFQEANTKHKLDPEVLKQTNAAIQKMEVQKSKNSLDNFKQKLSNKKDREEFMRNLETEVEKETTALQDLIDEASPPPNAEDPETLRKSLEAVDRLIADIKASEIKYKLIEKIAKGGIQVLIRVVPASGMVESCRKLAFEAVALGKKAVEVEKWRKNVNLMRASNSPYYHAVKERHTQAAIQVSQKTINTFLSIIGVASETARLADSTQASVGLSIASSMGQALSDFGYKTYGRAKIVFGWRKYLEARQNPQNRKIARQAIAWNSTLAKCVLAYGIVNERDPIARQVGRNCGLTPEILVSDTDVCAAVVRYFETLYSEDPVVLRRVPKVAKWHPGTPELTLKSWFGFKRAATQKAYPLMSNDSCMTPVIDQALKALHIQCDGDPFYYPSVRNDMMAEENFHEKILNFATVVKQHLVTLEREFMEYRPVTAKPTDDKTQVWEAGRLHSEMMEVADSLCAQATLILREVNSDLEIYGSWSVSPNKERHT